MRMGLSALNAQRRRYNLIPFRHCLLCQAKQEDPKHFFLHCPYLSEQRKILLTGVSLLLAPGTYPYLLPQLDEDYYTKILLCGSDEYSKETNSKLFIVVHIVLL